MNTKSNHIDKNLADKQYSIKEYLSFLQNLGNRVVSGDKNYLWVKYEGLSAIRFPEFNTIEPGREEIRRVFKKLKCILLSYIIIPNDENFVNSTLYNCSDNEYEISRLSKNARRDIRIGERNLRVGFVNWDDLLAGGLKAFKETRSRVSLSDGDEKSFRSRFTQFRSNPAHSAVAAWLGDEIIAFMSLIIVDDFVIIQGSFSTDDHRSLCPNNILANFVLSNFLNIRKFSTVCYGLSSIQENTQREGLHNYKVRIGFDAIPVQRIFLLHPRIAPFKGLLRLILRVLLFFLPHNRSIRKASGILESLKLT